MHLRCHAARTVETILSGSSLDESKKQPLRAEFLRLSDAKQSQWIEVLSAIDPGQRSAQALLLLPREDHLVVVGPLCSVVFAFGGARVFSVDACGRALSLLVVRSPRSSSRSRRSRRYVQAGCALRSLRPLEFCVCPLSRRAVWRVRAFGARCVRFVPLRGCRVLGWPGASRFDRVRLALCVLWFRVGPHGILEFCVVVSFLVVPGVCVAPGGARSARGVRCGGAWGGVG